MNKGQSATVGAILLTGFLLKPFGSQAPATLPPVHTAETEPGSTPEDGPWKASCRYWAAVHYPGYERDVDAGKFEHHVEHKSEGLHLDLDVSAGETVVPGCERTPGNRWGTPDPAELSQPQIRTMIAIVPDPVHTHFALSFDRVVDSILGAANDFGYASSYFWLPWKHRSGFARETEAAGGMEPGHDPDRERQPGLLILKNVNSKADQDDPSNDDYRNAYNHMIYLFLVAESDTEGIDSFEFRNALHYQKELAKFNDEKPFVEHVIGPLFTGSVASLAAAIDDPPKETAEQGQDLADAESTTWKINGATGTPLAASLLQKLSGSGRGVTYNSFSADLKFLQPKFHSMLCDAGFEPKEVAYLIEDNTAAGWSTQDELKSVGSSCAPSPDNKIGIYRYPREISMLRNAYQEAFSGRENLDADSAPSPYLHLSLRDAAGQDGVPHFSRDNSPESQEGQLLIIARSIQKARQKIVQISASNPLDMIFLAQFFRRECPEVRLFLGNDVLMERSVDNVPFVGSLSITPFPMFWSSARGSRPYSDATSALFHNAAAYSFWQSLYGNEKMPEPDGRRKTRGSDAKAKKLESGLRLAENLTTDYQSVLDPKLNGNGPVSLPQFLHLSLWLTTMGLDGYYPMAILDRCSSNDPHAQPVFDSTKGEPQSESCSELEVGKMGKKLPELTKDNLRSRLVYPSLLWRCLCVLSIVACLIHAWAVLVPYGDLPLGRNLLISAGPNPVRRAFFVLFGSFVLCSIAFVVAMPSISLRWSLQLLATDTGLAIAAVATGLITIGASVWAAWSSLGSSAPPEGIFLGRQLERLLIWAATGLLLLVLAAWYMCCTRDWSRLVGISFSYRCVFTGSGVAPLVPILFLLLAWFVWAMTGSHRLRFCEESRPRLPNPVDDREGALYLVSDLDLSCKGNGLFDTITCFFLERRFVMRLLRRRVPSAIFRKLRMRPLAMDWVLGALCVVIFLLSTAGNPVMSPDRLLWDHRNPLHSGPYDALFGGLFWPLLLTAAVAWWRVLFMWQLLHTGLLERLNLQPLRFAFSLVKPLRWSAVLRQGSDEDQRRDAVRSLESMRQILTLARHDKSMLETQSKTLLQGSYDEALRLETEARDLTLQWGHHAEQEKQFAAFATELLQSMLIPWWKTDRTGFVCADLSRLGHSREELDGSDREEEHPIPREFRHAHEGVDVRRAISLAEEFVVTRYIALIRAVLGNMRSLILFISVTFVLAIVALNSYPFQPRREIDWFFTGLLAVLGIGIVWVLAQMFRDPILSRITETRPNELGVEFYVRIVAFGAVPVITWLAYQFPEVGGVVFKIIQPALDVMR